MPDNCVTSDTFAVLLLYGVIAEHHRSSPSVTFGKSGSTFNNRTERSTLLRVHVCVKISVQPIRLIESEAWRFLESVLNQLCHILKYFVSCNISIKCIGFHVPEVLKGTLYRSSFRVIFLRTKHNLSSFTFYVSES